MTYTKTGGRGSVANLRALGALALAAWIGCSDGSGAKDGGTSGTGGGGGSGGAGGDCGGLTGAVCAANQWCDFPAGSSCGAADATGMCRPRPTACTTDCPRVCGCDGQSYCNDCVAAAAGVDVSGDGNCTPDGGGPGAACTVDGECTGGLKCCAPCGLPTCTQKRCLQPSGSECPPFP